MPPVPPEGRGCGGEAGVCGEALTVINSLHENHNKVKGLIFETMN